MTAPLRALRIAGLPAIEMLRSRWRALATVRSANMPFAGPEYAISAFKSYHHDGEPIVWIVEQGTQLEAVLPLVRRPLRRLGIQINEIGFPCNPQFILNDPLLPPNRFRAQEVAECILRGAATECCDTILLDHLTCENETAEVFCAAAANCGLLRDALAESRNLYFVAVDGDFTHYLASRSSELRSKIKRVMRRLKQNGGYSLECYHGRSAIEKISPIFNLIEERSWQAAQTSLKEAALNRNFVRQLSIETPESEIGELWLLHIGGRPAAALRMVGAFDRIAVHTMHFDPSFAKFSPGTILMHAMLQRAWEGRVKEVDLHGNSAFFARWATGHRRHVTLRLYQRKPFCRFVRQGKRFLQLPQGGSATKPKVRQLLFGAYQVSAETVRR